MTKENKTGRLQRADAESMESAQLEQQGVDFRWHYGRVTRLGIYDVVSESHDRRTVTIMWDSGGLSCQQGNISDDKWEILKMAFTGTGMVSVLSDQPEDGWMYDLRFLEALR